MTGPSDRAEDGHYDGDTQTARSAHDCMIPSLLSSYTFSDTAPFFKKVLACTNFHLGSGCETTIFLHSSKSPETVDKVL